MPCSFHHCLIVFFAAGQLLRLLSYALPFGNKCVFLNINCQFSWSVFRDDWDFHGTACFRSRAASLIGRQHPKNTPTVHDQINDAQQISPPPAPTPVLRYHVEELCQVEHMYIYMRECRHNATRTPNCIAPPIPILRYPAQSFLRQETIVPKGSRGLSRVMEYPLAHMVLVWFLS